MAPSNTKTCALYRRGCKGHCTKPSETFCQSCAVDHPFSLRQMIGDTPRLLPLLEEAMEKYIDYGTCVSRTRRYIDAPWVPILISARVEQDIAEGLVSTKELHFHVRSIVCTRNRWPDALCEVCLEVLSVADEKCFEQYFWQDGRVKITERLDRVQ